MVDTLVILIICSVTAAIIFLILSYFKSEIIYLGEIENQDKEEIIQLMKISFIRNDIEMEKMEIPKIYNNIYYRIFFIIYSIEDLIQYNASNIQTNFHMSFDMIEEVGNRTKYCCTISDYADKPIELLERMRDKYKEVEKH